MPSEPRIISTLFGDVEVLTPAEKKETRTAERKRKAKLAYDHTTDAWKRATFRIAVDEFLIANETFLFEQLSDYYNAQALKRGLPATVNGKAFAGLQRRLVREGLIESVPGVTRMRSNSQLGIVYRSNKFKGSIY